MSIEGQGHSLTLVKGHSDFKVKCLTFGMYTQVSDSGPLGPLVFLRIGVALSFSFFLYSQLVRFLFRDMDSLIVSNSLYSDKCLFPLRVRVSLLVSQFLYSGFSLFSCRDRVSQLFHTVYILSSLF